MTKRSVTHATFTIERTYDASPARVFAAWSHPDLKARWFVGPADWEPNARTMDFRIGGHETSHGGPKGAPLIKFEARYYDIVPNERIITAYEMHIGDARISVSVATLELHRAGKGTRLVLTEQGAYLDGHDIPAQREEGTKGLLDKLAADLAKHPEA